MIPTMRRLGRWMFDVLALLSLLLCVGTAGLWVRSYYHTDRIRFVTADRRRALSAETLTGQFVIHVSGKIDQPDTSLKPGWTRFTYGPPATPEAYDGWVGEMTDTR